MTSETLRSDAVKTEAVLWENGSRALWKLKGGNDRTALALQGMSVLSLSFVSKDILHFIT